jgi:hypothetical protein
MNKEGAEALAIDALGWLAADPDALGGFLAASGAGPAELRARATEPEFLIFLLEFMLSDEERLLAFCGDRNHPPDAPMRALVALGGGNPHWT